MGRQQEGFYQSLIQNGPIAYAHIKVIVKENQPVDFIFLETNPIFDKLVSGIKYEKDFLKEVYFYEEGQIFEKQISSLHIKIKGWKTTPQTNTMILQISETKKQIPLPKKQQDNSHLIKDQVYVMNDQLKIVRILSFDQEIDQDLSDHLSNHFSKELENQILSSIQKMKPSDQKSIFDFCQWKDLKKHHYHLEVLKGKDGEGKNRYTILMVDITQHIELENEIKDKSTQLERFFRHSLDMFCISDHRGNMIQVNYAWESILGFSKEKIEGKNILEMVHPDDVMSTKQAIDQVLRKKKLDYFTNRLQKRNGAHIEIEWKSHIYEDFAYSIGREVTQTRKVEKKLDEKTKEQQMLLDNIDIHIWHLKDPITYGAVNQAHLDFLGKKREEVENKSLYDILPEKEVKICLQTNQRIFNQKLRTTTEEWLTDKHQQKRLFSINKLPIQNEKGKVQYVICSGVDITDQEKSAQRLKESEARYRGIIESQYDLIVRIAPDNTFIDVNDAYCKKFGKTKTELIGNTFVPLVHEEDRAKTLAELKKLHRPPHRVRLTQRAMTVEGWRWIAWEDFAIVNRKGEVEEIQGIGRDVTENIENRKQLEESLREKEVLLKEIHHRVKNNLQVISSMIYLQANYTKSKDAKKVLKESENRIKTMATLHEKVYQSKDLSNIHMSEYIQEISRLIFEYYKEQQKNISLKINIDKIDLSIEQSLSCGLIANELMTNALQHGFKEKKQGEIVVSMKQQGKNIQFEIADNGQGFPKGMDVKNTDSLGLQLVINLVKQLKGEIKTDHQKGTKHVIVFPLM